MRILLNMNVLLWTLAGSPRIEPVRALIESDDTEAFVSAVSWWEIAIKTRIGKLDADLPVLRAAARNSGLIDLPLSRVHADVLLDLPRLPGDPFDHMSIAQAISEPMRFITGDSLLADYSPLVMVI